ncbi:MAG: DUF1634 domain-containing protein [Elusimicrobia bacterium]|nr:DUF1634 domain-containing protein [Elusimicrobiota bacterium]
MSEQDRRLHVAVSRVLAGGMALSLAAMVAGTAFVLASGGAIEGRATPIGRLLPGVLSGDPTACLSLGLVTLLATPALRVAALLAGYLRRRDWLFASLAAAVLAVLALSLLLGSHS